MWTSTTTLIPILVSLAALGVSALTYIEQRSNDAASLANDAATFAAASLSAEQHDADQVAFWIDVGKGTPKPVLMIENLGSAPISNVEVSMSILVPSGMPDARAYQSYTLGLIPPCTMSSTSMTPDEILGGNAAEQASASAADFQSFVSEPYYAFESQLDFTDATGRSWQRDGDGSLRELKRLAAMPAVVSLHSTFKPTATCS